MSERFDAARWSHVVYCAILIVAILFTIQVVSRASSAANPAGSITQVTANRESITLGQSVSITLTGTNLGGQASEGDLQISFPDDQNLGSSAISITSSTFPSGQTFIKYKGDQIWQDYGSSKMAALYPLIGGYQTSWKQSSSYSMTVKVTPSVAGVWHYYAKLTMADSSSNFEPAYCDPSTGAMDQQSEYIKTYSLNVKIPMAAISVTTPSSNIMPGQPISIKIKGTNNGGTALEGDLELSFPDDSTLGKSDITIGANDFPAGQIVIKAKGESIYSNYGLAKMTAKYTLVDGYITDWTESSSHEYTITVVPKTSGDFNIFAKFVMADYVGASGTYKAAYSAPSTGTQDQQSEYVETHKLTIAVQDTVKPVLTVTSPKDKMKCSTKTITVTGTCSDNVAIQKIELSTDGINWVPATGTTTWYGTVTLKSGSNSIRVKATDTSGNAQTSVVSASYSSGTEGNKGFIPGFEMVAIISVLAIALMILDRARK